jgi:hypothetical protein
LLSLSLVSSEWIVTNDDAATSTQAQVLTQAIQYLSF